MKQRINKLLKLNFVESFLQVNYLRGYKYIDKAGEIVNHFYIDNKEPIFEMALSGLSILKPRNKAEEIRITSKSFWAHFVNPGSFEEVEDFFVKEMRTVATVLDLKDITRIGWRHYFVYDFSTEKDAEDVIKKFSPINKLELKEIFSEYECGGIPISVRLKKVSKNNNVKTPGILIDVDFYKKFSNTTLVTEEVPGEIEKIKKVIKSTDFLDFINEILK